MGTLHVAWWPIALVGIEALALGLAVLVRGRPVVMGPRWQVARAAWLAGPIGVVGVVGAVRGEPGAVALVLLAAFVAVVGGLAGRRPLVQFFGVDVPAFRQVVADAAAGLASPQELGVDGRGRLARVAVGAGAARADFAVGGALGSGTLHARSPRAEDLLDDLVAAVAHRFATDDGLAAPRTLALLQVGMGVVVLGILATRFA